MSKIKYVSIVVGTRPQIIKSQPLINQLKKDRFKVEIINTGQHYDYDLFQKIFSDLKISKPSLNLNVGSGTQIKQMAKIISKLENYLQRKLPHLVIVPGDTTSALAGALTASKCRVKLAHLEAGARSNQYYMSEEINRRLIDHCSDVLFTPTKNCLKNLKAESVFGKTFFVGDTMYDLFLNYSKKHNIKKKSPKNKQILVTIHRAENITQKSNLKKICELINSLHNKGYDIIFPLHPHTKKMLKNFKIPLKIEFTKPMSYLELMKNLSSSSLVITDSGGLQKEAYWMGRPCITLRESTEWVETIKEKANFLFPLSKSIKIKKIEKIAHKKIKPNGLLYGNGHASKNISDIIKKL